MDMSTSSNPAPKDTVAACRIVVNSMRFFEVIIDCSGRTWDGLERGGNHSLVLDRVDGARRVDNAPALLEHSHRPLEDPELQANRPRTSVPHNTYSPAKLLRPDIVEHHGKPQGQHLPLRIADNGTEGTRVPVQPVAVHGRPVLPNAGVLAHCPVTAAWYVAQYAVEEELVLLLGRDARLGARHERGLARRYLDRGEDRRVEVRDHQRG